jgi:hypothetical protein
MISARSHQPKIAPHDVGQLRQRTQPRLRPPQLIRLESVEHHLLQPLPQPLLERRDPVPSPLMLRPLDQPDVQVVLDQLDPSLHDLAIGRRPVSRQLGDRRRPMPLEPLRLDLPASHLPSQHDLEGALAELDRWSVEAGAREGVVEDPVNDQHLPVELLLKSDHLREQVGVLGLDGASGCVEGVGVGQDVEQRRASAGELVEALRERERPGCR